MRRTGEGQAGNPYRPDPDKVPATLPAFVALGADAGGRLWVERFTGERLRYSSGSRTSMGGTPEGPRRFEIYSAAGTRVADVAAPDSVTFVRPVAITQDRFYAFVPDDDGVLHLVAYRIER